MARIVANEDNISALWKKWDSMQKWLIGTLVAVILNLLAVAIMLSKVFS